MSREPFWTQPVSRYDLWLGALIMIAAGAVAVPWMQYFVLERELRCVRDPVCSEREYIQPAVERALRLHPPKLIFDKSRLSSARSDEGKGAVEQFAQF